MKKASYAVWVLLIMAQLIGSAMASDTYEGIGMKTKIWHGYEFEWLVGYIPLKSNGGLATDSEKNMVTGYLCLPQNMTTEKIAVRSHLAYEETYRIAFYDAELACLGGDVSVGSMEEYTDTAIPAGAVYMRLTTDAGTEQDVSVMIETLSDNKNSIEEKRQLYTLVYKDQLEWVDGEGIDQNGEDIQHSGRSHTDYIKLPKMVKRTGYYISPASEICWSIAFYDSDRAFVASDKNIYQSTMKAVSIPENAVYFRLGCDTVKKNKTIFEVYTDQEPRPDPILETNGISLIQMDKYDLLVNGTLSGLVNYDLVNSPNGIPEGFPVGPTHWIKFYSDNPSISVRVYSIMRGGSSKEVDVLSFGKGGYFTIPMDAQGLVVRIHISQEYGPVTFKDAHCGLQFFSGNGSGFEGLIDYQWR